MTYASPFLDNDHEAFQGQARRFVEKEISPHVEAWETAGELPRDLHRKAAEAGLLQIGYPEHCGGIEVPDLFYANLLTEELARAGSGGVIAGLMSHGIATPPICHVGTPAQQARFARPVLEGQRIAALAITEPSGGSDVANLRTRAVRDGDHYVVNGSKTFITSGMRADFLTVAVRTGGPGMGGVSLLVVEQPGGLQHIGHSQHVDLYAQRGIRTGDCTDKRRRVHDVGNLVGLDDLQEPRHIQNVTQLDIDFIQDLPDQLLVSMASVNNRTMSFLDEFSGCFRTHDAHPARNQHLHCQFISSPTLSDTSSYSFAVLHSPLIPRQRDCPSPCRFTLSYSPRPGRLARERSLKSDLAFSRCSGVPRRSM